jgi:hypothetical protein
MVRLSFSVIMTKNYIVKNAKYSESTHNRKVVHVIALS